MSAVGLLVVGLGNPGTRYSHTRHNVGFRVLDRLAPPTTPWTRRLEREGQGRDEQGRDEQGRDEQGRDEQGRDEQSAESFDGELLVTRVDEHPLVLLKPLTFMNASGKSVRKAMSFFEISVQSTLVVHDELDLPLGAVKLKRGGGEAGHHGLESVSREVGSRDYLRLRVGVGKPASGNVSDFLLEPLDQAAEQRLDGALSLARDAVELLARQGIERAMNQVNRQPALC